MKKLQLYPAPQRLVYSGGSIPVPASLFLRLGQDIEEEFHRRGTQLQLVLPLSLVEGPSAFHVEVKTNCSLPAEGYFLQVEQARIQVLCGGPAGAFYALLTLGQLMRHGAGSGLLPLVQVEDSPALELRGILLDIGRNKIPKVETLKLLLNRFAAIKLNHVQLYMDGYCFEWPRYRHLFSDETPLTAAEVRELVAYANARFIDLVPNCNTLGHMEPWLALPQFRRLAECEDGFDFQGLYHRQPGTIHPQDPAALEFVQGLLEELVPNFTSAYVNVNLDEPFELGKGKSAELQAREGKHEPYLRHVENMHRYCTGKGKRMMMWADVLLDSPESIARLPRDITLLHWMYEGAGSFEREAAALGASPLDFVLCPGTNCWCSFTGRSESMRANVADAVGCAVRYGAKGVLLTDWGDLGHWQYISASYLPFVLAAGLCWSGERHAAESEYAWCDAHWFGDESHRASRLAYNMGCYTRYENAPLFSTTLCCGVMTSKHRFATREEFGDKVQLMLQLSRNLARGMGIPVEDPDIHLDAAGLEAHMQSLLQEAETLQLKEADGAFTKAELLNAGRFVLHGLRLYLAMQAQEEQEHFAAEMEALYVDMEQLLERHFTLWTARNRRGGYTKSSAQLLHLMQLYNLYRPR